MQSDFRGRFARQFVRALGLSPMRYLTLWRMQVAAQRLRETHLSLVQVAAEVGYESEAAFARAFKREFGITPAAWRRESI